MLLSSAVKAPLDDWLERYGDAVLRTCYLLLRDLPMARQATLRIFVRVNRSAARPSNPLTHNAQLWLLRQVTSVCRGLQPAEPPTSLPGLPCHPDSDAQAFLISIMRLPYRQRETLLLRHYHGLTLCETARVLRSPTMLIRWRIRQAKRRMLHMEH